MRHSNKSRQSNNLIKVVASLLVAVATMVPAAQADSTYGGLHDRNGRTTDSTYGGLHGRRGGASDSTYGGTHGAGRRARRMQLRQQRRARRELRNSQQVCPYDLVKTVDGLGYVRESKP